MMTPAEHTACNNIYTQFKRSGSFKQFRSFKRHEYLELALYADRVENIIDSSEIDQKLKQGFYDSVKAFVVDVRRMAGNCLRFCIEGENLPLRKKARELLRWIDDRVAQELGPQAVARLPEDTFLCLDTIDFLLGGATHTHRQFWARIEPVLERIKRWEEYQAEISYPCDFGRLTSELVEEGISPEVFLGRAEIILKNAEQFWSVRDGVNSDVVVGAQELRAKLMVRAEDWFPIAWPARRLVAPAGSSAFKVKKPVVLQRSDSLPSTGGHVVKTTVQRGGSLGGGGVLKFKIPPAAGSQNSLSKDSTVNDRQPSLGGGDGGLPKVGAFKFKVVNRGSSLGGGVGGGIDDSSSAAANASSMAVAEEAKKPFPVIGGAMGRVDSPAEGGGGAAPAPNVGSARKPEPPKGVFSSSTKPIIKLGGPVKRSIAEAPGGSIKDETAGGVGEPAAKRSKPTALSVQPLIGVPQPGAQGQKKPFTVKVKPPAPVAAKPVEEDDDDNLPLMPPPPPPPSKPTQAKGTKGSNNNKNNKRKAESKPKRTSRPAKSSRPQQPAIITAMPSIEVAPSITAAPTDQSGPATTASIAPPPRSPFEPAAAEPAYSEWEVAAKAIADKIWRHKWVIPPRKVDLTKFASNHRYHRMAPPTTRYCFDKPVLEKYPELHDAYLAMIDKPMDMGTVRSNLDKKVYRNADEFLADCDRVFANSIAFNVDQVDNAFSQEVCLAAKHLRSYLDALAAEYFAPRSEEEVEEDVHFNRSAFRHSKLRSERETQLRGRPLKQVEPYRFLYSQMAAFVKSLKAERIIADTLFDRVPEDITAYYAIIQKPMWLRAVISSLDESQPPKVGDVIDNLVLIYQNALTYNTPHEDKDKLSAKVCNAARLLKKHLDDKLPKVLLDMWEHEERNRIQERVNKLAMIADGGKSKPSAGKGATDWDALLDDDSVTGGGGSVRVMPPKGSFGSSSSNKGRVPSKHPTQLEERPSKLRKDERNVAREREDKRAKKEKDKVIKDNMMDELWGGVFKRGHHQVGSAKPNGVVVASEAAAVEAPVPAEPKDHVQAMDVVVEEGEAESAVKPAPASGEGGGGGGGGGPADMVLGDFFPVTLGKRKKPEEEASKRKGARAVLEELLGGSSNLAAPARAAVGLDKEEAMVKELQAQLERGVWARQQGPPGQQGDENDDQVVDMEEGSGEARGARRRAADGKVREVHVLTRRVEPPVWREGEWESSMTSLAFPSTPLVDLTIMTRVLTEQEAEGRKEEEDCRIFFNGEPITVEGDKVGGRSLGRKRAKGAAAAAGTQVLKLELGSVPVALAFQAAEDEGRSSNNTLEALQEEMRALMQSEWDAGAWGGAAGSLKYRDRMLKAYSWLGGLDLDLTEGGFYVSHTVQTEERGTAGHKWRTMRVVAEETALAHVRVQEHQVYARC